MLRVYRGSAFEACFLIAAVHLYTGPSGLGNQARRQWCADSRFLTCHSSAPGLMGTGARSASRPARMAPTDRLKPFRKFSCRCRPGCLRTELGRPSAGLITLDSQDERRWRVGGSGAIVLFPRPTLPAHNKTETGHDQDSPSPCVPFVRSHLWPDHRNHQGRRR